MSWHRHHKGEKSKCCMWTQRNVYHLYICLFFSNVGTLSNKGINCHVMCMREDAVRTHCTGSRALAWRASVLEPWMDNHGLCQASSWASATKSVYTKPPIIHSVDFTSFQSLNFSVTWWEFFDSSKPFGVFEKSISLLIPPISPLQFLILCVSDKFLVQNSNTCHTCTDARQYSLTDSMRKLLNT